MGLLAEEFWGLGLAEKSPIDNRQLKRMNIEKAMITEFVQDDRTVVG